MARRTTVALALLGALAAPAVATAQSVSDTTGTVTAVFEALGQGLGQGAAGTESVFVYAKGRSASEVAPTTSYSYSAEVSFSAPTAVEAIAKRDLALQRIRGLAQQLGLAIDVVTTTTSYGRGARPIQFPRMPEPAPATPAPSAGAAAAATPAEFTAAASVRLSKPPPEREGLFLDALHAAGADNISSLSSTANGLLGMMTNTVLNPSAPAAEVDPRLWDEASANAVAAARAEATVLAHAAGREVGPARQILELTRGVENHHATVTVAVRFALADKAP